MSKNSCFSCDKPSTLALDGRLVCNSCYCHLIEKKIKRQLRLAGLKRDNHVLILGALAHYFVKKFLDLPLIITTADVLPEDTSKFTCILTSRTLDDTTSKFIDRLLFGSLTDGPSPAQPKIIHLLEPITDEEAATYAALKNQPFSPAPKPTRGLAALKKLKPLSPHLSNNLLKSKKEIQECLDASPKHSR